MVFFLLSFSDPSRYRTCGYASGSLISRAIDIVHQTRLAGVTEVIIVGLRRKSAGNMGKPKKESHRRFYVRFCPGQSPDSVSIARVLRTLTRPLGMPNSSAALSTKELGSSMKYAPEPVNRRQGRRQQSLILADDRVNPSDIFLKFDFLRGKVIYSDYLHHMNLRRPRHESDDFIFSKCSFHCTA